MSPTSVREPEDGGDEEVGVARGREQRAEERGAQAQLRAGEEDRDEVEEHDALPQPEADRQRAHAGRGRDRRAGHRVRPEQGGARGRLRAREGVHPSGAGAVHGAVLLRQRSIAARTRPP
jgi:hypothetical protein